MKLIHYLSLTLLIVIILDSCRNAPKPEVLDINSKKFISLKNKIEKHNCNCSDSLSLDFEASVIEFEKNASKARDKDRSITTLKILAESYQHLTWRYSKMNRAKSNMYSDKRVQALEDIIDIGRYNPTNNWAYKSLESIYRSKKSTLTDFDPQHEYYDQLISEISSDLDAVRYTSYQLTDEMSDLLNRAKHKKLTKTDTEFINNLLATLFKRDIKSTRYRAFQDKYAINLLLNVIANNQLQKIQIDKIRSLAIIARVKGFSIKAKDIASIIWWCEVRSITNLNEQMKFLNQQMLSSNQESALKMLVELGKVDEIRLWAEILEFEISDELFEKNIVLAQKNKLQLKK